MRIAGGVATGVRRGGRISCGEARLGICRRGIIRIRCRAAHIPQNLGGASGCLSCPAIVVATP